MTERPLVLVADDDPDILELVVFGLERAGFATVAARNGAEALELAQAHRPAVAVLDVMMPLMDGCEVTRRVRAEESTARIPVLLLTALADAAAAERGLAAGADGYVTKPFSPKALAERIGELAARHGGRSAA